MSSGDGYFLTYVDKKNKLKLVFEFNQHNPGVIQSIQLGKY